MKKYNLAKIIGYDFFYKNFCVVFLFFLIFISAMSIVIITYKTRLLIIRENILSQEQEVLEVKNNDLFFKENFLINLIKLRQKN